MVVSTKVRVHGSAKKKELQICRLDSAEKRRCWHLTKTSTSNHLLLISSLLIQLSTNLHALTITTDDCGSGKGCFRFPESCTNDCNFLVTYNATGRDKVEFELSGRGDWVAVGFSNDREMPDTDILLCASNRELSGHYYTSAKSTPSMTTPIPAAVTIIDHANEGGMVKCRISRDTNPGTENFRDLSQLWYLLGAIGSGGVGGIEYHGFSDDNRQSTGSRVKVACSLCNDRPQDTKNTLQCQSCFASKSWDDCDRAQAVVTCPLGYDRCGNAYVERRGTGKLITGYSRGCVNEKECDPATNTACNLDDGSTNVTKCDITCCQGSLCNEEAEVTKNTLQCQSCFSSSSWEDCDRFQRAMTCPSGYDRCGKAIVERRGPGTYITGYSRGCMNANECNPVTNTACNLDDGSTKVTKCDIHCCHGSLCNGTKLPLVSSTLFLACVFAAFS